MSSQTKQQHNALRNALDSVPLYVAVALILVALLASFYLVLLFNMDKLESKTEDIKQHPYTVAVASGRTETLLTQIRTLDDRLAFTRSEETVASVQSEFTLIDQQIQQELATVVSRYLGDPEAAVILAEKYEVFKGEQQKLIELSLGAATDEEAAAFLSKNISPRIDEMLEINTSILKGSSGVFDQLYDTVSTTHSETMTTATILLTAVVAVLILFMLVLAHKNSQRRELQESLSRALENAQDANVAKSRFLSNVSHDIRTPLTAIVGLTDIVSKHTDDQRRVDDTLEKIKLSSRHLLNLVNDVLDMSKIESGQIDIESVRLSPCTLVDELASFMRPQAEAKGVSFEVVRCKVASKIVVGDEMRANQILINLLGNAIKYTETGGHVQFGAVELAENESSLQVEKDARCVIRFVVQDDGIGMSEDFLKHIFEPFEREDRPVSLVEEGTGLGMSIAKNLIDLMGGSIEVQSKLGSGTTFTVDLPFETCEAAADCSIDAAPGEEIVTFAQETGESSQAILSETDDKAASPSNNLEKSTSEYSWSHVRVLLAEDNELVGEISEEFITSTGASVERAWDGLEVLELLKKAPDAYYDLIIMDIQMPHMDGLEAARTIVDQSERTGRPRPPIVAMTANAYVEDRMRAREAGMDGYVIKPIGMGEIARLFELYVQASPPEEE